MVMGAKSAPPVLVSVVVSIPACHPGGRGSIPRRGGTLTFWSLAQPSVLQPAQCEPVFSPLRPASRPRPQLVPSVPQQSLFPSFRRALCRQRGHPPATTAPVDRPAQSGWRIGFLSMRSTAVQAGGRQMSVPSVQAVSSSGGGLGDPGAGDARPGPAAAWNLRNQEQPRSESVQEEVGPANEGSCMELVRLVAVRPHVRVSRDHSF